MAVDMGYFNWNPDEPLIDQHPGLYKRLISNRGGCKCFICPPCSACTSEIDEDEAEELGLVPYPPEHKPKEKEMELKVDFNKLDFPAIQAMIQTPQDIDAVCKLIEATNPTTNTTWVQLTLSDSALLERYS